MLFQNPVFSFKTSDGKKSHPSTGLFQIEQQFGINGEDSYENSSWVFVSESPATH